MKSTIYMKSIGLPERAPQAVNIFLTKYSQRAKDATLSLYYIHKELH